MDKCIEVTNEMIMEHSPLVHFTINKYFKWMTKSYVTLGIEYDDIYQTGIVGLIKAIKAHDESRGKISTIAVRYIRTEIIRQIIDKHKYFKVGRDILQISRYIQTNGDYDINSIKQKFKAKDHIIEMTIDFARFKTISTDITIGQRKKEPFLDILEDKTLNGQFDGINVEAVTSKLTKKQKDALFLYLDGYGQPEIAKMWGFTQAYVSLLIIEAKAIIEREYHLLTGGIVCNN